jgi:hypothetical protein
MVELGLAMEEGIPIIPLRIEDVLPSGGIKFFLAQPQWLDAFPPPYESHLQKLTKTVEMFLAQATVHLPANRSGEANAQGRTESSSAPGTRTEIGAAPTTTSERPTTLFTYLKGLRDECAQTFSSDLIRPDRVYVPQYAATLADPPKEVNLSDITAALWTGAHRRLALLGNYGMGKTYFTWRTTLDQVNRCEREREQAIPILYPLKKFNYVEAAETEGKKRDLIDQILDHAILLDFPKIERRQFVRWIEDGIVGVILDGLDELSLPRDKRWVDIVKPVAEIDGIHLLLMSRTAYLQDPQRDLDGYDVFELLPWGEREWETYLECSGETLKTAGGKAILLKEVASKPKLASLTTRPLWCFMIVSIAEELPQLEDLALSGLYQQFLNRAVKRRPLFDSILSLSWQYCAMERFAEECVRSQESSLTEQRLLTMLSRLFEAIGHNEIKEFLTGQVRTYAFLNCDRQRRYSYGHKSFEDYFSSAAAARWLAEKATGQSSGPPQIIPHNPLLSERRLADEQMSFLVGILQENWIVESLEIASASGSKNLHTKVILFLQRELSTDQRPALMRANLLRIYVELLRAQNSEQRPLLSGFCLKAINLAGLNLANCIFQKVDFTEANLTGVCFAGSSIAGCVFSGANLDAADFTEADLTDADFRWIESPKQRPIFKNARGVDRARITEREQRLLF